WHGQRKSTAIGRLVAAVALTGAAPRADSAEATAISEALAVHVRPALLALVICLLAPLARAADGAPASADAPASAPRSADDARRTGNVLKLRKTPPAADHTPTLESFVQLASTQSVDAVYKTFADEPVQANGELALKSYLASEVMPFFADVER